MDILNEIEEDFDVGKKVDVSGKIICVFDIFFFYNEGEFILKYVFFDIKFGEVIVFVGLSGGGKLILFVILECFY